MVITKIKVNKDHDITVSLSNLSTYNSITLSGSVHASDVHNLLNKLAPDYKSKAEDVASLYDFTIQRVTNLKGANSISYVVTYSINNNPGTQLVITADMFGELSFNNTKIPVAVIPQLLEYIKKDFGVAANTTIDIVQ